MQVSVSVEIKQPATRVWQAMTNFEHYADMIGGVNSVEVIEKPETGLNGLKWKETRTMFGKDASETMWITNSQDLTYYETRAESHGSIYTTKIAIEEKGEATRLTMDFKGQAVSVAAKMLSFFMSPFITRSLKKALAEDLEDIKTFLEGNQGGDIPNTKNEDANTESTDT